MLLFIQQFFPKKINFTARTSQETRKLLQQKFPGTTFTVYDLNYDQTQRSVPAVLYLDEAQLISDTGKQIGFICPEAQSLFNTEIIATSPGLISDLSSSDSATLIKDKWALVNPSQIYRSTEEWR